MLSRQNIAKLSLRLSRHCLDNLKLHLAISCLGKGKNEFALKIFVLEPLIAL
eukprot:UN02550